MASSTVNSFISCGEYPDPWEDQLKKGIFLGNYLSHHPGEDPSSKDVEYVLSTELARHIAGLTTLDALDDTDDPWRSPYAQAKFRNNYQSEHPYEDITELDAAHTMSLEVAHDIAGVNMKLDNDDMKLKLNYQENFRLVDRFTNRSLERRLDREIMEATKGSELSDEARLRAQEQFKYIKTHWEKTELFYCLAKKKYTRLGICGTTN